MWRVLLILMLINTALVSAADSSVRLLAWSCRNCHYAQGDNIVSLESLTAQQITTTLLDFKSERRRSTVMGRLAKGFTDEEIRAVAGELDTGLN
jgi:cytochrome subunit of sulfide dehydrogenase